ncbi:MAG: hypothetical protein WDZ34_02025 [Candidatus Saccharimonadales bacterium]
MSEKLKQTVEMLWQDEKDFLAVLSLVGVKRTLASLRAPIEVNDTPGVYKIETKASQHPDGENAMAYSVAA